MRTIADLSQLRRFEIPNAVGDLIDSGATHIKFEVVVSVDNLPLVGLSNALVAVLLLKSQFTNSQRYAVLDILGALYEGQEIEVGGSDAVRVMAQWFVSYLDRHGCEGEAGHEVVNNARNLLGLIVGFHEVKLVGWK